MEITLLIFLQHHYPSVNVAQHFTQEAIERNKDYRYDEGKGAVVDDATNEIDEDEEDLLGFEVNLFEKETLEKRPDSFINKNRMPNDDDSVSTLGALISPQKNTSNNRSKSTPSAFFDNFSINSPNSTITMETVTTLQSQIALLQSRLDNQDNAT